MNTFLLNLCLFASAPAIPAESVPTPRVAVNWALADVRVLPAHDRPHMRYEWIPPFGNFKWVQVSGFAVNAAASHSSRIHQPALVANGWLLRWDLRLLADGDDGVYKKLVETWDRLAINEPYFHVSIVGFGIRNEFPPVAPHIDGPAFLELATNTHSACPIVRADYLIVRMLSTLDGGLYYDFRQIERKPAKGSAQDAYFAVIGVDLKESREKEAQKRVAILKSRVTKKPRRVDIQYSSNVVRPDVGTGLVLITHDTTDESVKAIEHPLLNLFAFVDAAREVIVELPNGLHEFTLWDNRGALQDSVPDNIAKDHEIPAPNTARLMAAIGCIRCHGPDEGLKTAQNDIATLLDSGYDVFDDSKAESIETALESLAAFYLGKLDKPIRRGRDDYSEAVFVASRGMTVPEVSQATSEIYASLVYDSIDAERAALEAGWRVKPDLAVEFLKTLVPPLPPLKPDGRPREHAFIAFLKAGDEINRKDFDAVYADLAERAMRTSLTWRADDATKN